MLIDNIVIVKPTTLAPPSDDLVDRVAARLLQVRQQRLALQMGIAPATWEMISSQEREVLRILALAAIDEMRRFENA
jgi:hypothetical protein